MYPSALKLAHAGARHGQRTVARRRNELRSISFSLSLRQGHYDTLCVSRLATRQQIKASFYKVGYTRRTSSASGSNLPS